VTTLGKIVPNTARLRHPRNWSMRSNTSSLNSMRGVCA
jgi:hypothetical protein